MRVIDISVPISPELPVWPGDPPVELVRIANIADGANANVSRLACGVHVGTHVDAPVHFVEGAASIESLPLDRLIGRAYVAEFSEIDVIDDKALDSADLPAEVSRMPAEHNGLRIARFKQLGWITCRSRPSEIAAPHIRFFFRQGW